MIGCRPIHHTTSRIRYTASLEPLGKGTQPDFEPLHTGYPIVPLGNCTWEKGTRFVSFTFYQSISPCLRTNSLLCLHRLMIFLFIQVRSYSMLRRATRWRGSTEVEASSSFPLSYPHPLLSCHPKPTLHASVRRSRFIYAVLYFRLVVSFSSSHMFSLHIRVESSTLTRFFVPDVENCFKTGS